MLYLAIFGEMRRGSIVQFLDDPAIHRFAVAELGIQPVTETAVAAGASVAVLGFAMNKIHDGRLFPEWDLWRI